MTDLATEEPITSTQKTGRIDAIETVIVDLPLKRPHFHASGTHARKVLSLSRSAPPMELSVTAKAGRPAEPPSGAANVRRRSRSSSIAI
ncbi:hypothetical protein [Rhizorhabdus wittichii]